MMKLNYQILLFLFFPMLIIGQVQIGQDINGEDPGDLAGWDVSLSSDGNILALSSIMHDGINGIESGRVRVFQNVSGTWTQVGGNIDGESPNDRSGRAICLSANGDIIAISAIYNGSHSGHVRIFENQAGTWTQIGGDIQGIAMNNYFGTSLSLSSDGSVIAIGAPLNEANGSTAGYVRVYENVAGNWAQIGGDIIGEVDQDHAGVALDLSSDGSRVAIGATYNDGNGMDSGHVRVYENQSDSWVQIGSDLDGEGADDRFGTSVSLSSNGDIVAIGGVLNDGNGENSGHVRVFHLQSGNWIQLGDDIDGFNVGELFGESVELSSDGNKLVVGAIFNGTNGIESGNVRVFENQSGNWTQIGQDINGEAANDRSGASLGFSSDGSIVAIGAYLNDGNGMDSGHVRVYDLNESETYVPDDNFENYLETHDANGNSVPVGSANSMGNGIANDNFVTTANINIITELTVNNLSIADLTGIEDFTSLTNLDCGANTIESIDMSNSPNLTTLYCRANYLTSLDVSQNTNLITLNCADNLLDGINISQNTNLESLIIFNNNITNLDVSQNTVLEELNVWNNLIPNLDVSLNLDLTFLDVSDNLMNTLDVSNNSELLYLACVRNNLTSIDVTQNPNLEYLLFNDNLINNVNLTQNTNLIRLDCDDTPLENIDLSFNTNLMIMFSSRNQLTNLDLSNQPLMQFLQCNNNSNLESINARSGSNTNFLNFDAANNSILTCIEVDNSGAANAGLGVYNNWDVSGSPVTFSESCETLNYENFDINLCKLYPNPSTGFIYLNNCKIENLNVFNVIGQMVYSSKLDINLENHQVDLNHLQTGVYLVKISLGDNQKSIEKIIKL